MEGEGIEHSFPSVASLFVTRADRPRIVGTYCAFHEKANATLPIQCVLLSSFGKLLYFSFFFFFRNSDFGSHAPCRHTYVRIGDFVSVVNLFVYNTQRNNAKRGRLHVLSFERCLKIIMHTFHWDANKSFTLIINRTSRAFTVENTEKRGTHTLLYFFENDVWFAQKKKKSKQ